MPKKSLLGYFNQESKEEEIAEDTIVIDTTKYDKYGYDEKLISKDTGTIYNQCGFKRNGIHFNGTKYDQYGKTFEDCYLNINIQKNTQ